MNKIISILTLGFLLCSNILFGQTDVDALRYSLPGISGTARYTSMSGAFGALGGDFSCLASNPAGIGIYRSSEFTFTPSIFTGNTESKFLNSFQKESRTNFNFGNVGLVFTNKLSNNDESPGWKSWNFGFGYNRTNDFNNRSTYNAFNAQNSFTDYLAENAQGLDYSNLDPYYEYLGYYTYLINPDTLDPYYYTAAAPNGNIYQRRSADHHGSSGEMDFTFGGNYSNKLYIGATFAFNSLHYYEDVIYEETDKANLIDSLNQFTFNQHFSTHGTGFNFKLGMIYRPEDWIRIGAAFQTPIWYYMHDDYYNNMYSRFDRGQTFYGESPIGLSEYRLTTPFKFTSSIAFLFQKYGLISADVDFEDLSQARLEGPGYDFYNTNSTINYKYKGITTVRLGTEWKLSNVSFRAGAAFYNSPITPGYKVSGSDFSKTSLSGGLGFRENNFFLDFGYVYSMSDEYFQPYTLTYEEVPGARNTVRTHNFTMTFGVKF